MPEYSRNIVNRNILMYFPFCSSLLWHLTNFCHFFPFLDCFEFRVESKESWSIVYSSFKIRARIVLHSFVHFHLTFELLILSSITKTKHKAFFLFSFSLSSAPQKCNKTTPKKFFTYPVLHFLSLSMSRRDTFFVWSQSVLIISQPLMHQPRHKFSLENIFPVFLSPTF